LLFPFDYVVVPPSRFSSRRFVVSQNLVTQWFASGIRMADEKHSDALDHVDEEAEKLKDVDTSLQLVDDQDDPAVKRIKRKVDFRLSAILAVRLWNNSSCNHCANSDCQLTSCFTASTKSTAPASQMRKGPLSINS
jgi:hypothetical protein